MPTNPPSDVATFLSGNFGLTLGTNLFRGLMRDNPNIPVDSVFVHGGAGLEPDRVMTEAYEIRFPIVHIRVRDSKYDDGDTLARNLTDLMRAAVISGYIDVTCLSSDFELVDRDEDGHWNWLISHQLTYIQS